MDIPTMRDLTTIKTLERMADAMDGGEAHISMGTMRDWFGGDEAELTAWRDEHEQRGLIARDGRLGANLSLTPAGLAEVERVRQKREDRGLRRRVCRARVLHWVDSRCADTTQQVASDEFRLSEHAWFEGEAFGIGEVDQAIEYLVDESLLHGSIRAMGTTFLRIGITSTGQDCVTEFDSDVAAYLSSQAAGSAQISVSGQNNTLALALGENATATATAVNVDAAIQLANAFREVAAILQLSEEDLAALEDIETEDDGRVRRGLRHLARFANDSATGATGSVLGTIALKLLGA